MAYHDVPKDNELDLRSKAEKRAAASSKRRLRKQKTPVFYSAVPGNLAVPLPGLANRRKKPMTDKQEVTVSTPKRNALPRHTSAPYFLKPHWRPPYSRLKRANPLWLRYLIISIFLLQIIILGLLLALSVWGLPGQPETQTSAPAVVFNGDERERDDEEADDEPAETSPPSSDPEANGAAEPATVGAGNNDPHRTANEESTPSSQPTGSSNEPRPSNETNDEPDDNGTAPDPSNCDLLGLLPLECLLPS